MFGKPEWFTQSSCCSSVLPATFKGWLYLAGWGALIVLPMLALGITGRAVPEAFIWLGFSALAFLWDMRTIRGQLETERQRSLFFIGGESEEQSELATRHFDMKLRG
jgi:hypothetical protein